MNTIRVVNGLDFPLKGRFAGVNYEFPVGKGVDLSEEAAAHIFAFGVDDHDEIVRSLNHLGLLPPTTTFEVARKQLNKVKFLEGHVVFEDEDSPAPTENGRARVNLGGEGGVARAAPPDSPPRRVPAPPMQR